MNRYERWEEIVGLMRKEANERGFHFRATSHVVLDDIALCTVISACARLYVTMYPCGDVRVRYRRHRTHINLVADIHSFDLAEIRALVATLRR